MCTRSLRCMLTLLVTMVLLVPQAFLARDACAGEEDLVWSTYLGGDRDTDYIEGITVDDTGAVYAVGYTNSDNFPTTEGAFDPAFNGYRDAFVLKFHPDGSSLEYGLFLGGYEEDRAQCVAVDATGAAYVTEVDGVKVRYSLPGCAAYYNGDEDTLTIEITDTGGDLLVKCGEEAYVVWGDFCDLVISAPDASINNMILKGTPETQLHVAGNVGHVKNFKLKYGCVGDTEFYGEETGLGCTSLEPPNKILLKWGWTTAPVLGVSY